jgi:hypothetical protein
MENLAELEKEFTNAEPWEQWAFAIKHKDIITVHLDNDDTYITFNQCKEDDDEQPILTFANYIGNSDGVEDLLFTIGINAEGV